LQIFRCDLRNPEEIKDVIKRIIEELEGRIDGLINAAGTISCAHFKDTTLQDFDASMNVNVRAPMQLMSILTPFLKENQGVVVNISASAIPRPKSTLF